MMRGLRPATLSALLAALVFTGALFGGPISVLAQLVPANLRAAIFVRALGYERSFASGTTPAKIVVVKGASGEAAQDGAAMARAFEEILRAGGTRRQVTVTAITMRELAATVQDVEAQNPAAIYLPRGLYEVAERLGSARGVVVFCAAARDMERACTLSVEVAGSSPRLVVNLAQANRAGLRFDARLLGLSRVIR
ncbi:MAG: DUF4154 domain-containing protein [Polyangiaceae bacterium]|nr:DUF4154 domain-containing protein [Polyangiaceae bacterium]